MDLPHIFLPPEKVGKEPRPLGTPRGPRIKLPYNEEIVTDNYTKAIGELQEIERDKPNFLLIELNNCDVWGTKVKEMLKKLDLTLVKIFTDKHIIVKIKPERIGHLVKKLKARHEYIKETVVNIKRWTTFEKVFSELKEKALQNTEHFPEFSIVLSTFENVSEQERELLRSKLEDDLKEDEIPYYYNEDFKTYQCEMKIGLVEKYSKNSFVENIRPTTNFFMSEVPEGKFSKASEAKVATVSENDLKAICVIDTGVSKFNLNSEKLITRKSIFQDDGFDNAPNGGHGTRVASLAMFGQELLDEKLYLIPKAKIISHKLLSSDSESTKKVDFLTGIRDVVKESIHETNIFNMSMNFTAGRDHKVSFHEMSDYFIYIDLTNKIDRFIRENNMLLINSVGNIPESIIEKEQENYPDYLAQNHVLFPAFARNVVSVGAYFGDNELSTYTRLGAPYENSDFDSEEKNFISPIVLAFGGEKSRRGKSQIKCFNNVGEIKESHGTSFSAPIVSLALRMLTDKQPQLQNSESMKAILLNSCNRVKIRNKKFFQLPSLNEVGKCEKEIYFNFEGTVNPIFPDYKKSEKTVPYTNFKFFMPKGAYKMEFVLVHSSTHPHERCNKVLFKPSLELKRSSGGILNNTKLLKDSDFEGNIDTFDRIHYGTYTFDLAGDNFWGFRVSYEHETPMPEFAKEVQIRFGLSIKISFKDGSKAFLEKAYNQIVEAHKINLGTEKVNTPYNVITSMAD